MHGLRGVTADVYLDGALVLQTFEPERATQPMTLSAGTHKVEIRVAGSPADSTPALASALTIPAGAHLSAVVHQDAAGAPEITVFNDDVSQIAPSNTRVVVRNVAAGAPVDVVVDGHRQVTALASGEEHGIVVLPSTNAVSVASASGGSILLPAQDVTFAEGTAYFMYLIGSAADRTLGWLAESVDGLATVPNRIQTGDSGLASPRHPSTLLTVLAWTLCTAVAGGLVLGSVARRARRLP